MMRTKQLLSVVLVVLLGAPHAFGQTDHDPKKKHDTPPPAADDRHESVEILIGVRFDAAPFAIRAADARMDDQGRYGWDDWSGFTVDICKKGVSEYNRRHPKTPIKAYFVEIEASERIDRLVADRDDPSVPALDMVCGAVSVTPDRQARVPFSDILFVDARAAGRVHEGGLFDFANQPAEQDVLRVGYVTGSTAKESLADVAAKEFPTHIQGLAALACKKVDLYVTDRSILQDVINNTKNPVRLALQDEWAKLVSNQCPDVYPPHPSDVALFDPGTDPPLGTAPDAQSESTPDHGSVEHGTESMDGTAEAATNGMDGRSQGSARDESANETTQGIEVKEHYLRQSKGFFANLTTLPNQLSLERYAIPVREGRDGLLWAINLAIADNFRGGGEDAFRKYFPGMQPTPLIKALIFIRGGGQ
ncbi:transporter substrate-binding domain-containing protein [uncultured Rhodospira sp.]|uniref:transporter substrate-binding domain-containing protein n=1 Tax=uncultured Rhodospira sp. TaxID=1936189 RepID=UPI002604283C|nr:transporter substrate-binding domain-containing protein [uncultured Rhodospira sp.]